MKCTKCGKEFEGNYCPECGEPSESNNKTNSKKRTRLKAALSLAGVLIIILAIIGIIYNRNIPAYIQNGDFFIPANSTSSMNNTSSAKIQSTASASSSDPDKLAFKVVNEQTIKFSDSLGDANMVYMAEVKNTGKVSAKFNHVSIDAEDKDGKIIKSKDMVSVYPNVINPGETAYICESVINSADNGISINSLGKAISHFEYRECEAVTAPNIVFSEVSLKDYNGYPKLIGRIENKSDQRLSNLHIAASIRDTNGKLQGVIFTIIHSLNPGEKKGFEQLELNFKKNQNYNKSTIKPFAFEEIY